MTNTQISNHARINAALKIYLTEIKPTSRFSRINIQHYLTKTEIYKIQDISSDEVNDYLSHFYTGAEEAGSMEYNTEKFLNIMENPDIETSDIPIKIQGELNSIDLIDATKDPTLKHMVKTASYKELESLMNPKYPLNLFVSGDTGVGKSSAVMSIRQSQGLPVVRVNLSFYTDLDDLIGGIRLENGDTIFEKGPVIVAMETPGCTLILDEITQCNPRILMDLQPILELRGYLIKKTKTMVYPAKGFNIIGTSNSRGLGDNTGEFVGENILNKATRDRFPVYLDYATATQQEMSGILNKCTDLTDEFCLSLSKWYGQVQKSVESGVVVEGISPRRMKDIAQLFLNREVKELDSDDAKICIKYGTSVFDISVTSSLVNLWDMMIIEINKNKLKKQSLKKEVVDSALNGKDEDGDDLPF